MESCLASMYFICMLSFLCFTLNCCCLLIRSIEIASSTLACLHILSVHPNVPNLLASCSITESREEGNGNDGPPVRWNSPTCPLDSQACAPAVGMGCSTCLSPPPPLFFFVCVCMCYLFFHVCLFSSQENHLLSESFFRRYRARSTRPQTL